MFKKNTYSENGLHWINFFIIKKDREKMGERIKGTRTEKIFAFKNGNHKYIDEITDWVVGVLDTIEMVIVPYPSTDQDKDKNIQLPYVVAEKLSKINEKWINGSSYLKRKAALPKNTRDAESQYQSLDFEIDKKYEKYPILLLDDVITSGSSLEAGLRVIREKSYPGIEIKALAVAKKVFMKEVLEGGIY